MEISFQKIELKDKELISAYLDHAYGGQSVCNYKRSTVFGKLL